MKTHLKLDIENGEKTKDELSLISKLQHETNLIDSQSVEIGSDKVRFVKENMIVGRKGIKKVSGHEYITKVEIKDLVIEKDFIGHGATSLVQKAMHKPTGIQLAIKSINIYDKDKRHQLKNDLKVLKDSKSPFLIRFYGAFFYEGSVKLALEYMDLGSLDRVIEKIRFNKYPCTPEPVLSRITNSILQGLLYLHKIKHQIHRDIKPGNVLINRDGQVKLTDFGISRTLESTAGFSETFVGTRSYMSPERIEGKEYSYSSDIWSLGLLLYEMASGNFPYKFSNVFIENLETILKHNEPTLPSDSNFSYEIRDFISKCLCKGNIQIILDPRRRLTTSELCSHPWILKYMGYDEEIKMWLAEVFNFMVID